MKRTSFPVPTFTAPLGAAILVGMIGVAGVAFGCSKGQTPAPEQVKPGKGAQTEVTPASVTPGDKSGAEDDKANESAGAPDPEELKSARASYAESNFDLAIHARGDGYKAGQDAEAEIVLEAKAPYHVNDKYPYKFKLADSAGVEFKDKIVKKDKAKIEAMKVTMTIPFTAKEAGKKKLHGIFHFSVCSEDKCLIEKRALALDLDVK